MSLIRSLSFIARQVTRRPSRRGRAACCRLLRAESLESRLTLSVAPIDLVLDPVLDTAMPVENVSAEAPASDIQIGSDSGAGILAVSNTAAAVARGRRQWSVHGRGDCPRRGSRGRPGSRGGGGTRRHASADGLLVCRPLDPAVAPAEAAGLDWAIDAIVDASPRLSSVNPSSVGTAPSLEFETSNESPLALNTGVTTDTDPTVLPEPLTSLPLPGDSLTTPDSGGGSSLPPAPDGGSSLLPARTRWRQFPSPAPVRQFPARTRWRRTIELQPYFELLYISATAGSAGVWVITGEVIHPMPWTVTVHFGGLLNGHVHGSPNRRNFFLPHDPAVRRVRDHFGGRGQHFGTRFEHRGLLDFLIARNVLGYRSVPHPNSRKIPERRRCPTHRKTRVIDNPAVSSPNIRYPHRRRSGPLPIR